MPKASGTPSSSSADRSKPVKHIGTGNRRLTRDRRGATPLPREP
jgi:hypothetical protein